MIDFDYNGPSVSYISERVQEDTSYSSSEKVQAVVSHSSERVLEDASHYSSSSPVGPESPVGPKSPGS